MKGLRDLVKPWAALLVIGLLAAACGAGGGGEAQLDRIEQAASDMEGLAQEVESVAGAVQGMEDRITQLEGEVQGFRAAAEVHALSRTAPIPEPPEGKVAVRLSFHYQPQPLAGDGILAHQPTPEVSTLWAMDSLPKGQPVPAGEPIADRTLFLAPGEEATVTLVYRNPSSQDVGFLVLPHQESPGSQAPNVWPTCMCMSFVYTAPAEGAWYRVIRLTASPDMPAGSKVDILWTVLTDPSVFPEG